MGYGLKYELIGKSRPFGKIWKVRIYQNNYTGPQIDRNIPVSSFVLRKDSAGTIRGTSLEFAIRAVVDFEFIDFYTENYRDWLIHLIDTSNTVIWKGYILPEKYQEEYKPAPVAVNFTATDQLGVLKNITYNSNSSNRISYLSILMSCLSHTGLSLGFALSINIKESRQNQSRSPLSEIYINPQIFNGKSCYDVIIDIISRFGADITQQNARWLIRNNKTDSRLLYSAAGVYESIQPVTIKSLGKYGEADIWTTGSPLSLSLEPSPKMVALSQDYVTINNMVPLQSKEFWIDDSNLSGWNTLGSATLKRYDTESPYFTVTGRNTTSNYFDIGVKSEVNNVEATTCDIRISFEFAVYYAFLKLTKQPDIYVQIKIEGATNYWLSTSEGWKTTSQTIKLQSTSSDDYTSIPFSLFSILVSGIPVSGKIVILFSVPYHSWFVQYNNTGSTALRNIEISHYVDEKPIAGGISYQMTLNNSISGDEKQISTTGGDVPDIANKRFLFKGYSSLQDGTYTGLWNMAGIDGTKLLNEQLLKLYASNSRKPQQILRGTIRGQNIEFDTVIQHNYPTNRKFEIVEASYNLCDDKSEVTLVELLDFQDVSYQVSESVTEPSGGNSSSGNSSSGGSFSSSWPFITEKPFDILSDDDFEVIDSKLQLKHIKYNSELNRIDVLKDLHVTGNITASEDVIAYVASAVTSDVLAGLTATAPLRKSSASNIVLDYNTSQFEAPGGILQIKAGVLAPSAHSHLISDVTGLQSALDSKMVVHTHPYRADSWVPSWSDVTGKPTLLDLGETSSTAYRGDRGKIAYNHSQTAHQSILNGTGFVKVSGTTVSYDNSTYLTGITKAQVEAVLTGGVTSHTHSYLPLAGGTLTGQLISTVATGTAPFTVASTTSVSNLNADFLDGYHASYFQPLLINPITGTGTANYIPKFTGTGTIGNSQIFDDGTSISILKSSAALYIDGTDSAGYAVLVGRQASSNKWLIGGYNSAFGGSDPSLIFYNYGANPIRFYTNSVNRIHIGGDGFTGIGYTSDPTSGNKLAVNGNAYINGTGTFIGDVAINKASPTITLRNNSESTLFNAKIRSLYSTNYALQLSVGDADRNVLSSDYSTNTIWIGSSTYSSSVGIGYNVGDALSGNKLAVNGNAYINGNLTAQIATLTGCNTQSMIIKNSSGTTKWTVSYNTSTYAIEFKNASGVLECSIDQSGNLKAKGEVTAYATM